MIFKLLFIAVFVLQVLASGSLESLPLPPNVVVISGKNDAFFTSIVSTVLAVISFCSFKFFASQDSSLLSVDANVLYSVLNGRLALVRKHDECIGKCNNNEDCLLQGGFFCKCAFPNGGTEGVSSVPILRRILY